MEHTSRVPAAAAPSAVGSGQTKGGPHADVILILGPDIDPIVVKLIREACEEAKLSLDFVGDGERAITKLDIQDLHRNNRRGPDTHVFVSGHGSKALGPHRILGGQDGGAWLTTDLIEALLTNPDEAETAGARSPGRGIIHMMSCEAGSLKTEFTPKNEAWRKGSCLVHASTKTNATGTILPNAIAVIKLLGDYKEEGLRVPDPQLVFATVAGMTGECLTLFGGALLEEQTWHAPKSAEIVALQNVVARLLQDKLEKELLARQGRLDELKDSRVTSYADKFKNAYLTLVLHGDARFKAFLAEDPSLAHATGVDGVTCLMIASTEGHVDVVTELIRCGAKIHATDQNGATALHHACARGRTAVAIRLVELGADVNSLTTSNDTPLRLACMAGNVELAKFLLTRGAKPEVANADGHTPLIVAAEKGISELAICLLENGANCNATDNTGNTALHHACYNNKKAVVTTLLLQGDIEKNRGNNDGFTPLSLSAADDFEDISTVLIASGADLDIRDPTGRTLLHTACAQGQEWLAALIVDSRRANINIQTTEGETPLSIACANGRHHYVKGMVSAGADVNLADNIGRTPLMRAALAASSSTAKAMIAANANLDAQDIDGSTALMHACWVKDHRTVSALLEAGASTQLRNAGRKTALDLVQARLNKRPESEHTNDLKKIVALLISAGAKEDV